MSDLQRLSDRPLLLRQRRFVPPDVLASLVALCRDDAALEAAGVTLEPGGYGASGEVPLTMDPQLERLAERIQDALGLHNEVGGHLRLRRYSPGQGHPAHIDTYRIAGHELLATALVCVEAAESGGHTLFPDAEGGALAIRHEPGQLVAWHNLSGGLPEPTARHLGVTVEAGAKTTLAAFVYGAPESLRDANRGVAASAEEREGLRRRPSSGGALRGLGRLLAIVDDGVPEETVRLLRAAAEARGVRVAEVDPKRFDFGAERTLRDGDLLFRPAVSMHAMRVEQHLWHPGVATFHRDPEGPLFANVNGPLTFSRAGLPVPRTYWLASADRDLLRRMVDGLGGLPVVLKLNGYSSGVGVMRADSLAGLYSLVDFVLAEGGRPLLTAYVDEAVHWRIVVVGDRAAASYRNVTDADDFRTSGSDARADYLATPPAGAEELAVRACHALRTDHGGVDILEHPSGRLYLLEANSPCYFPQAQLFGEADIAGAMVDQLLARAEAVGPASEAPLPALDGEGGHA